MINGRRVLVVIPAVNEASSIAEVVSEVRGELAGVDVLVVDDGSTDDTGARAAAAGATVARLPYNLGVGGAMRTGYRYARDHGYEVAIQVDADGQHDPRYVPKLVDALAEADLVIGARFAGEGDYRVRGPRAWYSPSPANRAPMIRSASARASTISGTYRGSCWPSASNWTATS